VLPGIFDGMLTAADWYGLLLTGMFGVMLTSATWYGLV
jgi:hypothetical protein